jgi:hypothetical protein
MREIGPRPRRARLARGRIGVALFVGFVVAPLVTAAIASTFLFRPAGRLLEVEMRAKGGTFAQVFWSSGFAMSPEDSSIVALHQQPGEFERVRLTLPDRPLEIVRFDPLETPGEVVIRQLRVLDANGRILRTIDPKVMMPLHQIQVLSPDGEGARVVTTPDANDAMLLMRSSWVAPTPRWYSLQFVTPFSLAWIAGAVIVLIATALFFVIRDIVSSGAVRRDWLWLAALFVAAVWAKLLLLQHYPVPVPIWDQWDGEALTLYIPWASDGVTWRQMFTFHNEHRIFFSRVLALGLMIANGQWDPHLQISVNTMIHGIAAVVLAAALWMAMDRRHLPGIALAISLVCAPPFALENSLAGFQSAFYFLLLFSVLALWLMGAHRPGSAPWFLGIFCALCCLFTVAGGVLIVAGIGCVAVLRALADRSGFRPLLLDLAALAVIAAVGYAALPPPIPYHEALKAGTVRDFSIALARNFAFPWINYPRAAAAVWLPLDVHASHGSTQVAAAVSPQAAGELQPIFDSYALGRTSIRFESTPASCRDFRRLRFELAGSRDWSGLALSLEDAASKARIDVQPPWGARGGWIGVSVPCPAGAFTIVASDDSPGGWLAFRQPAEIASASALVESMVSRANAVGVAALVLVGLALGSTFKARRQAPASRLTV